MCGELAQKTDGERAHWTPGDRRCLCDYLHQTLTFAAVDTTKHDEEISQFAAAMFAIHILLPHKTCWVQ